MRRAVTIVLVLVSTSLAVMSASVTNGGAEGPHRSDPLVPGVVREILVANVNGVPLDAVAVTLNVTVAGPYSDGYLTVFPCGELAPTASNLNFRRLEVAVANAVIVRIGAGGKICLVSSAVTSVIVDVAGHVPAGSPLALLPTPRRLLDTREGVGAPIGRSGPGVLVLDVAGQSGIASDARAAVLNVTVVDPAGSGYATVFPCDQPRPEASNVNFVAGDVRPNLVLAGLDPQGRTCIFTTQPTHLVVDATASISTGPGLRLVTNPERVLDTRSGLGATTGPVGGGQFVTVQIAGRAGVPTGATSVVLNVTATESGGAGFVTAYPCGSRPTASNLNHAAAQTIANLVVGLLDDAGRICLFTSIGTHLVADVAGWFDGTSVHQVRAPDRLYDSRTVPDVPRLPAPIAPIAPGPVPTVPPMVIPPVLFPTDTTSPTSTAPPTSTSTTSPPLPHTPIDTDAPCDYLVSPVRNDESIVLFDLLTGERFVLRDNWFETGARPIIASDCSGFFLTGYASPGIVFSQVRLYAFDGQVFELAGTFAATPWRTHLTELIDGRLLASEVATTWDADTGEVFFRPNELLTLQPAGISRDGSVLAVREGGWDSHDVFVYAPATGELISRATLPPNGNDATLSPNGTLIASGAHRPGVISPSSWTTPTIRLLDGTVVATYPLGEELDPLVFQWVSDEQLLVCADRKPPRLWTIDGDVIELAEDWDTACPTLG